MIPGVADSAHGLSPKVMVGASRKKRRLIPHVGQEATKSSAPPPIVRCKKILEHLPLAKAHELTVILEAWVATRQMEEHQLEARLHHDH